MQNFNELENTSLPTIRMVLDRIWRTLRIWFRNSNKRTRSRETPQTDREYFSQTTGTDRTITLTPTVLKANVNNLTTIGIIWNQLKQLEIERNNYPFWRCLSKKLPGLLSWLEIRLQWSDECARGPELLQYSYYIQYRLPSCENGKRMSIIIKQA